MAVPVIALDASLADVLDENSFTQGKLQSSALTAPFTAQFDTFLTTWTATNTARIALVVAIGKARGAVSGADDTLDDFIDRLDRTLLIALKNNRKAPVYELYFGSEVPSKLKRPILGEELERVRKWIPSLQGSPNASVAALATPLVAAVAAADVTVSALAAAEQALADFDTTGGKRQLIDAANAMRQTTYGQIAALPHQNPEENLPVTFADRFFRHVSHKGVAGIKTPAEAAEHAARLQRKLTAVQNHAANLAAEQAARTTAKETADASAVAAATAKKAVDTAKKAARDAADKAKADKAKAKRRR